MKIIVQYLTVILLFVNCSNNKNITHYDSLKKAYSEHNYFKLNSLFNSIQFHENNPELLLYKAKLKYVFNEPENSNILIDNILDQFKKSFNDTILADLFEMKFNNDFRLHNYKGSYDNISILVNDYSHVFDSAKLESLKEDLVLGKAIIDVPKMIIEKQIPDDIVIPVKKDIAGLLNLSVHHNNDSSDFIFDTGANTSVVTKSIAKKFNINILPDKAKVYGLTGIKMDCDLGYSDITIGDIVIKNALFIILADSLLSFADGYYVINGIIGFPVINALKEIIIDNDKVLTVPMEPELCEVRNFALDNLNPTILVEYKNDSLPFHFDTGADKTLLYNLFFEKYKEEIVKNYSNIESFVGGAGGILTTKVFLIDSIKLKAGETELMLDSIEVLIENIQQSHTYVYGNFGQDYLRNYSRIKINFESMCIKFSNE